MTTHFRGGEASRAEAIALPKLPRSLHQRSRPSGFYGRMGKRFFDMTLVLLALPIWVPLIVLCALPVLFGGQLPIYRQLRLGKGNKVFSIYKLRTMRNGADDLLEAHLAANPAARAEWDDKQKLEDDPRITRFGQILRRTSLDELPQLWNVLRGDMSLVGPRPMMVEQADLYPGAEYYTLRPGITGPWQISDRSQGSFCDRARFDRAYFRSVSLKTDLEILWKTIGAVLNCTGR